MTKVVCSQCGREEPDAPEELARWRHGRLVLEAREAGSAGEVPEGILLCPDCDADDRERAFEEGGGD